MAPAARARALPTLALLSLAATARAGWSDDFATFNSTLWSQQTDIEHCNDGACFLASPDHLDYDPNNGLTINLNQSPCNTTSDGCCVGSKCASWASGHLRTNDVSLYGTYTMTGHPAHAPDGSMPPTNAFSCWTPAYIGSPHNEIALCFSGFDPTTLHLSYWYDATVRVLWWC